MVGATITRSRGLQQIQRLLVGVVGVVVQFDAVT